MNRFRREGAHPGVSAADKKLESHLGRIDSKKNGAPAPEEPAINKNDIPKEQVAPGVFRRKSADIKAEEEKHFKEAA